MKRSNTLNGLVADIKTALTTTSFRGAKDGMDIINQVLADNGCKTLSDVKYFCEKYGVMHGEYTAEHLIDKLDNPFCVNGYQLILNAFSLCNTKRYFLAVLKNVTDVKDKARTGTNL